MERWASGGIILSSVETRYQLGLTFRAGAVTLPSRASTPQGTCEAAIKEARSGRTSAANEAANFALSKSRKPSTGGRMGGTDAPGGGLAIKLETDSPASGAKGVMYT